MIKMKNNTRGKHNWKQEGTLVDENNKKLYDFFNEKIKEKELNEMGGYRYKTYVSYTNPRKIFKDIYDKLENINIEKGTVVGKTSDSILEILQQYRFVRRTTFNPESSRSIGVFDITIKWKDVSQVSHIILVDLTGSETVSALVLRNKSTREIATQIKSYRIFQEGLAINDNLEVLSKIIFPCINEGKPYSKKDDRGTAILAKDTKNVVFVGLLDYYLDYSSGGKFKECIPEKQYDPSVKNMMGNHRLGLLIAMPEGSDIINFETRSKQIINNIVFSLRSVFESKATLHGKYLLSRLTTA